MRVVAASVAEAVPANEMSPSAPSDEEAGVSWPDDTAESSYLAEARQRGEMPVPATSNAQEKEDADPKALPSLDELVERIPAGVREVLDDLFRAKFTKVRRIPRSALKE
jgi:hypothetical protein